MERHGKTEKGFTLVELLAVVAIVAILIGLVGAAAYSARQRAYRATAQTETQQLAAALRSWWIANRTWPPGFSAGAETEITRGMLKSLMGEGSGVAYINIPPDRFVPQDEGDDSAKFTDPWGAPYIVKLDKPEDVEPEDSTIFEGAASFPNQFRYHYESGVYDKDFKFADREWNP